jgi:PKD repeat protein
VLDYATNWDFGDGTTSTTINPKGVTFANPGTYTIRLITEAEKVCYDTFERAVKVFGVPQALFSIDDSTQCEDVNSFVITNSTAVNGANGLQYNWLLEQTLIPRTLVRWFCPI